MWLQEARLRRARQEAIFQRKWQQRRKDRCHQAHAARAAHVLDYALLLVELKQTLPADDAKHRARAGVRRDGVRGGLALRRAAARSFEIQTSRRYKVQLNSTFKTWVKHAANKRVQKIECAPGHASTRDGAALLWKCGLVAEHSARILVQDMAWDRARAVDRGKPTADVGTSPIPY